jgi:hypothetical protein
MSEFNKEKHGVFISYYHKDDQVYRDEFEDLFGHLFANKSVEEGDIDSDNSDEYIKRLIQEDYINDASVVVVLCGPNTWKRKHVDWEISAGLNKKVGGYSGLLGIHLPTHPDYKEDKYNKSNIPARLADNLETKFAKIIDWTENEEIIKKRIQEAFENRINDNLIDNTRKQMPDDIE